MRMLSVGYIPEDCSSLVDFGAQKRGSMPYQGPRSECNHCNNNMLATHKHNASALFWYTQRYHRPRTVEHGAAAGVTAANPYSSPAGPWTGPPYPRAPRLGPRAFSVRVMDSLGGNFDPIRCACRGNEPEPPVLTPL